MSAPRFVALKIILLLLAAVLLLGWIYRKALIKKVLPEVEKISVTQIVVDDDSAHLRVAMTVKNKGVMNWRVKQMKLQVLHDTTTMISLSSDSLYVLKVNERREQVFEIGLPYKKILRRIRSLQGQDSTLITIRGGLVFDTFAGDIAVPVNEDLTVGVPTPPVVYVRELEYLGKDEQGRHGLNLRLTLVNYNNVQFEMKDVSYEFASKELFHGSGSIDSVLIRPLDSTRLLLPVHVTLDNSFRLASKIVFNNDVVNYSFVMRGTITSLTGLVKADEIPAEFRSNGRTELLQRGRDDMDDVKITIRKKNKKKKKK